MFTKAVIVSNWQPFQYGPQSDTPIVEDLFQYYFLLNLTMFSIAQNMQTYGRLINERLTMQRRRTSNCNSFL
jgi:hypothetical protein